MTTAFSTGLSTAADLDRALKEACGAAGIVGADLACAFVSSAHGADLERVTMRKIAVALLIVTLGSGCAGVNRQVRKAIGDREPKLWFAVVVWGAAIAGALATKNSYWCVRDRFRPNAYCDGGAWNPYGP